MMLGQNIKENAEIAESHNIGYMEGSQMHLIINNSCWMAGRLTCQIPAQ
jgi:hypothetical protein